MKPQDILFAIVFLFLLYKRDSRLLVSAGICCLVLAMPLFATWVFFTAQRLIWYAYLLMFTAVILQSIQLRKEYTKK